MSSSARSRAPARARARMRMLQPAAWRAGTLCACCDAPMSCAEWSSALARQAVLPVPSDGPPAQQAAQRAERAQHERADADEHHHAGQPLRVMQLGASTEVVPRPRGPAPRQENCARGGAREYPRPARAASHEAGRRRGCAVSARHGDDCPREARPLERAAASVRPWRTRRGLLERAVPAVRTAAWVKFVSPCMRGV